MAAYAPDGRMLSPGEVYEAPVQEQKAAEWRADLNVIFMCPDCREDPPNLVEEFSSGDTVCGSCGRVLADRVIDTRSEWRTFSNDDQGNDDPSRVGDAANPLLNGSQLHTEIGFADGSRGARELSRAQNKNNLDKTNKALQTAYGQIAALCEAANIPKNVADQAKLMYKKADDGKVFKGKSPDAIIAGCIFIACRHENVPRSFREIFKLTNVSKKEIGRTFKQLESYLSTAMRQQGNKVAGNGAVMSENAFRKTGSTEAKDLIQRACSKLGLSQRISFAAVDIAHKIQELGVAAGRSPLSITGACIYLVSTLMGNPRSPKDIGQAVDVSDGTIRTAYKLIHQSLDKLIDSAWTAEKKVKLSDAPAA